MAETLWKFSHFPSLNYAQFTAHNISRLLPILVPGIWLLLKWHSKSKESASGKDASDDVVDGMDDPGLLKKHSSYASYSVPDTGFTYSSIRTFYRMHPHGDKLPTKPTPLPLLVCIHGLGGSIAQFHTLLASLVTLAPTLAIDLPGCGLSKFQPKAWKAYTTDALVKLLAVIIEKHRDVEGNQDVILVCHSMGCSLATLLTSSTSPYKSLISDHVCGVIAICPQAEPPTAKQVSLFRKLLLIPGPIFDLWRRWDRRGGTESGSILRFTGPNAEEETKRLQLRFNEQSRTPVWRRMASGLLPDISTNPPTGGIPGREIWAGMKVPLFLIGGQADKVTPAENVRKIAGFLGREGEVKGCSQPSAPAVASARNEDNTQLPNSKNTSVQASCTYSAEPSLSAPTNPEKPAFEAIVLPSPASHALLYAPQTARSLSAHIQRFVANNIDHRLNLGWQLQYLTREGKWDVKNLEKWQAVKPVSLPIGGVFRAMKTLREVDESHSPKPFVKDWAPLGGGDPSLSGQDDNKTSKGQGKDGLGPIVAVVDISHDSPVYDYCGLENGGIAYRKFPTVSKFPPTESEVKLFIEMIDTLRTELVPNQQVESDDKPTARLIAVHCHYGFNRTGFFIIAYLVERLGWHLKDAIAEFAAKRPPGVRHAHFVDELFARYWTTGSEKE